MPFFEREGIFVTTGEDGCGGREAQRECEQGKEAGERSADTGRSPFAETMAVRPAEGSSGRRQVGNSTEVIELRSLLSKRYPVFCRQSSPLPRLDPSFFASF